MSTRIKYLLFVVVLCVGAGCANITSPTGGKRDKTPPKLIYISPSDSLKNTKVRRIELDFDEYITVSDVSKEVQISPIIAIPPAVTGLNKRVVVKIVDTLLEDNTTYRLSFGNSIKDMHEGNPFRPYTYTFSTGKYFDSLQLTGNVINAMTGMPDAGAISVELYSANDDDTAVIRHKPKYVTKTDNKGNFVFKGLPKRKFRIYALKDSNNNLTYDGPVAGEMIGFIDGTVMPGDTSKRSIDLRVFPELVDSGQRKKMDSLAKKGKTGLKSKQNAKDTTFSYSVNVDTGNVAKRTFDINTFIKVEFNKAPVLNMEKIRLSYDSADVTVTPEVSMTIDSTHPKELYIKSQWVPGALYTLKLAKGFAKDTFGKEVMPARFTFRANNDEDYGKLKVVLPSKYNSNRYLLLVTSEKDTVHYMPVKDTITSIVRIKPGKYTLRIIADKNGNGKWDTGDLFGKLQPEDVIPYPEPVTIKANWENTTDFEQKPKPKSMKDKRDLK